MAGWLKHLMVVVGIGAGCAVGGGVLERDASAGAAARHALLGVGSAIARRRIRINVDIGGDDAKS